MIEPEGALDSYLICGIKPSQLQFFREGKYNLRELVLISSVDERFLAVDGNSLSMPLDLRPISGEIPEDYLSDADFYLHASDCNSTILAEAVKIKTNIKH